MITINLKQNKIRPSIIFTVLIILIGVGGLLFLEPIARPFRPTPPMIAPTSTPAASRKRLATFTINPSNIKTTTNETFTAVLNLDSKFPLIGADALLSFNPNKLAVVKITAGSLFSLYPRLTYSNSTGQILITGVDINQAESDASEEFGSAALNKTFATLTFRALSPGKTAIKFNFKYPSTKTSTAVGYTDAENILTNVKNTIVIIK